MKRAEEFRVAWKRQDCRRKTRVFKARPTAERYMLLFGPEPWLAGYAEAPTDPNALMCCSGYECGCDGLTVREHHEAKRKEMPALEYLRLETRAVGTWEPAP